MDVRDLTYDYNRFKFRDDHYHDLTRYRIREVMVVSTLYDAYSFEQDGGLDETVANEYLRLNLTTLPRITNIQTARDALRILDQQPFDLILTVLRIAGNSTQDFVREVKIRHPDLSVALLLGSPSDLAAIQAHPEIAASVDEVFLWNGDSAIIFAMIKLFEDYRNAEYDTRVGLVRTILLIEDSVKYYSVFLPLLYRELMKQTERLISEEVTEASRRLRMRMRPKILLTHTLEEAHQLYRDYKDSLLCIISDVEFHCQGRMDPDAGVRFLRHVQEDGCSVPLVLQSMDERNRGRARQIGAHFLHKASKSLLQELREFIVTQLGFGDFVFRSPKGRELARASSMGEFVALLDTVPEDSLVYHAMRDHFSVWLIAHGEVTYARKIKPTKVSDFASVASLRAFLVDTFREVERGRTRGRIVEYTAWQTPSREQVVRLAGGSLGGKGRGIAFLNALLSAVGFDHDFQTVRVCIPTTAIVGTDEFDSFLERNGLDKRVTSRTDEEIRRRFVAGSLSSELLERLAVYLDKARWPVAVRSSGLLEDSQSRPFAGVYKTYMLPNCHQDLAQRVKQLATAIKLVYASVFTESARQYIESVNCQLEEEKMAVVIQELVGTLHEDVYYPDVSGVAQSHNFYPTAPMVHSDGVALLALGLGKSVVEGGHAYRFCPRHPEAELLSPHDLVGNSQQEFVALNMGARPSCLWKGEEQTLASLRLRDAEGHGVLPGLASVWDYEFDRLTDDPRLKGPKVLTFGKFLRFGSFPLAPVIDGVLTVCEKAMGLPVEVEFSANSGTPGNSADPPTLAVLQIRPLTVNHTLVDVPLSGEGKDSNALVFTSEGLGNGVVDSVRDIVFVDPRTFDRTRTPAIREEIVALNRQLKSEGRRFVLLGPGRWGSRDRFLGVPVQWSDIHMARCIVEVDLEDFQIEASQGTHFLHNVVALNVGYFKVRFGRQDMWVDWEWLYQHPAVWSGTYCRHLRRESPCSIRMDGQSGRAAVYKDALPQFAED